MDDKQGVVTMNRLFNLLASVAIAALLGATGAHAAGSGGSDSQTNTSVAGYAAAKAAADAGNFAKAINLLAAVVKTDAKNADAWNLLGYSSRKLGQYDNAAKYYDAALRFDPKHLGALEYQGELYVETGQMPKAQENLARLQQLCGNCEEYGDLKQAIGGGS